MGDGEKYSLDEELRRVGGRTLILAAERVVSEALPAEMARVRDQIMPMYLAIGRQGAPALALMRHELDLAAKALAEGDVVAMIRAFESLRGYTG